MLSDNIAYIFKRFQKNGDMLMYLHSKPELFSELLDACLDKVHPQAWRATMLLGHAMEKNDDRVISYICLLYTSPSPRDATLSRMPSSA